MGPRTGHAGPRSLTGPAPRCPPRQHAQPHEQFVPLRGPAPASPAPGRGAPSGVVVADGGRTGRAARVTQRIRRAGAPPGLPVTGRSSGPALGYAPLDASGTGTGGSGYGPCGRPGRGAVPCSRPTELRRARRGLGPRGAATALFDSPQHASHSMDHAYSFALEYARSACCGDCTSTMLSRKGITFRDPEEARGDVSAGSDGVSGAGASGSAGGRSGSRRGGAGP